MKKNKVFSVALFVLLWVTLLLVNAKNGAFLYPENAYSIWRDILSVMYITSFWFLTYVFCDSQKLLIWYSVYAGLIIIPLIIFEVVGGNINEALSVIIGFPMAALSLLCLTIPLGITLYHIDKTGYGYIIIILMFYIVYFISRFIKKRKRKDDEKVENS